jgi:FtsP/CotA-like multicopper oxidase with cupredoxin domain
VFAGNLPDVVPLPPRKDSIAVPAGGYVVLRFHADNPGECTAK